MKKSTINIYFKNKHIKYLQYTVILLGYLFIIGLQNSYAQQPQKIDPTVKVERNFDTKMPNIHKGLLNTAVNDTLSSFNLNFNYSIFDKPYRDLYEFSPLPSAQIQSKVEDKYPVFLAKLGIGIPANPMADIWFQPHTKGGSTLQFNASFNGFYDNINQVTLKGISGATVEKAQDKEAAANSSSLRVGGTYGYHWNSGELSFGLNYNSNYNTYYGFNTQFIDNQNHQAIPDQFYSSIKKSSYMKENYSHKYNQVGTHFSINSIDAANKGARLNYKLNIKFLSTSDKLPQGGEITTGLQSNKLNENYIKASGEIGPTFGKYNKITIAVNSETVTYKEIQDYNYGIFEVTPQYALKKGRFSLSAGVKISARYTNKDESDKYNNSIFAKANISYGILQDNLWIYANIDGGNYINSYSSLLNENKWVAQNADLKASSIPFLLKAGFQGQLYNKFSYNIYAKYAAHKGLLQYIPIEHKTIYLPDEYAYTDVQETYNTIPGIDSRLATAYSNHNEFSVGIALGWQSKEFKAGTTLEYSNYTDGKDGTVTEGNKPYGYAPFKWYIYGEYNYRERIYIGASANIRGAAPVYNAAPDNSNSIQLYDNAEIEGFCNLGLYAKYVINPVFSLFINGENLLNANIQYYSQYLEKGISFSAGVLVKL